jgi:hypothetical protein
VDLLLKGQRSQYPVGHAREASRNDEAREASHRPQLAAPPGPTGHHACAQFQPPAGIVTPRSGDLLISENGAIFFSWYLYQDEKIC